MLALGSENIGIDKHLAKEPGIIPLDGMSEEEANKLLRFGRKVKELSDELQGEIVTVRQSTSKTDVYEVYFITQKTPTNLVDDIRTTGLRDEDYSLLEKRDVYVGATK